MKNRLKTIGMIGFLLFIYIGSLSAYEDTQSVKMTKEQKKKPSLKKAHANLSFDCKFCHESQGSDPKKFEAPDEAVCLSCHKTKEYLAQRLEFMDTLKANPHNSVHDGPNLYCDECHQEHKPSVNMCSECHLKEIKNNLWMKETP